MKLIQAPQSATIMASVIQAKTLNTALMTVRRLLRQQSATIMASVIQVKTLNTALMTVRRLLCQ
ncbi:hypothetical protein CO134_03625, partial [Candidatus Kuenenbacteria bacterium CG_4_9_14_3_um_filter_39_14]